MTRWHQIEEAAVRWQKHRMNKVLFSVVAPEYSTSVGLVDWNEKRGRTVQHVMAAFDQAIAAAEASE